MAARRPASTSRAPADVGRPAGASFAQRVHAAVAAIPAGRVATYGDVAAAAGRPRAARAVGTLMANGTPPGLPCHRVVAAGGALGGYGGHESMKAALLRAEGVRVTGRRIADFASRRWTM